ncbi:MAG: hypothetical protein ACOYK8_01365 [Alphaproteobacteria bacterium]
MQHQLYSPSSITQLFNGRPPAIGQLLYKASQRNPGLHSLHKRNLPALQWAVHQLYSEHTYFGDHTNAVLLSFFEQMNARLIQHINQTPHGLRFQFLYNETVDPVQKKILDQEFKSIKKLWLYNLATYFPEQLQEAKFSPTAIKFLQGNRPDTDNRAMPPQHLTNDIQWSIEHIKPRIMGGGNENNLMLMPFETNSWNEKLYAYQNLKQHRHSPLPFILSACPIINPDHGQYVFFPQAPRLQSLHQSLMRDFSELTRANPKNKKTKQHLF